MNSSEISARFSEAIQNMAVPEAVKFGASAINLTGEHYRPNRSKIATILYVAGVYTVYVIVMCKVGNSRAN